MLLRDVKESEAPDLEDLDFVSLDRRHKYTLRIKQKLQKWFRAEFLENSKQSANYVKHKKQVKMRNSEFLSPVDRLIPLELAIEPDIPDRRAGTSQSTDDSSSNINPDPEKLIQFRNRRLLKGRV
ncbi:hypothetical protein NPIL_383181 [Nephila pilipes]|uniref:Uncharacterized protein n=1 Tax=Nephila pilipes TaxID=299642 RepID=A0A8X6QGF8_NEPPI|nr:hypothetical protein NPIL_383181 [Nephila pilipes]